MPRPMPYLVTLLLLLFGPLAACQPSPRVDPTVFALAQSQLTPERVPHIKTITAFPSHQRYTFGSATPIGVDLLASCNHVLPLDTQTVYLSGTPVTLRILATGNNSESPQDDWTIAKVSTTMLAPLIYLIDPAFRPQIGQTIIVAGYRSDPETDQIGPAADPVPPLLVVAGEIVPASLEDEDPDTMITFISDHPRLQGLSGGPALVYDPDRSAFVLVGMLTATVRHEIPWLNIVTKRHHVARTLSFIPANLYSVAAPVP